MRFSSIGTHQVIIYLPVFEQPIEFEGGVDPGKSAADYDNPFF